MKRADEYTLSSMKMELDVAPGESCGFLKYHTPVKWCKQAKAVGKINMINIIFCLIRRRDSIIDSTFSRKVGRLIDESRTK